MSMIAGEVVLIHVHEGTIISSWTFSGSEDVAIFESNHRSDDWHGRSLPDGTFDDPASDSWITVEGALVEYVDGDTPVAHICTIECEEDD